MKNRYEKKISESFKLIEHYKKDETLELHEKVTRIMTQLDFIKIYFERMVEETKNK